MPSPSGERGDAPRSYPSIRQQRRCGMVKEIPLGLFPDLAHWEASKVSQVGCPRALQELRRVRLKRGIDPRVLVWTRFVVAVRLTHVVAEREPEDRFHELERGHGQVVAHALCGSQQLRQLRRRLFLHRVRELPRGPSPHRLTSQGGCQCRARNSGTASELRQAPTSLRAGDTNRARRQNHNQTRAPISDRGWTTHASTLL